jgi:acyl phosphate:glycerol-3-phosphate acyltransferase
LALFSIAVPVLIVVRHRTNLVRLFRGTEPPFQFGGKKQDPEEGREQAGPPTVEQ